MPAPAAAIDDEPHEEVMDDEGGGGEEEGGEEGGAGMDEVATGPVMTAAVAASRRSWSRRGCYTRRARPAHDESLRESTTATRLLEGTGRQG